MSDLSRHVPRLALNRTEVALALGVSVHMIDDMVTEGALPPPRRWHKRKLWLVREVEAFLTDLPSDGQHAGKESAAPADDEDWTAVL